MEDVALSLADAATAAVSDDTAAAALEGDEVPNDMEELD
jgi:hypothetical protein